MVEGTIESNSNDEVIQVFRKKPDRGEAVRSGAPIQSRRYQQVYSSKQSSEESRFLDSIPSQRDGTANSNQMSARNALNSHLMSPIHEEEVLSNHRVSHSCKEEPEVRRSYNEGLEMHELAA